MSLRERMLTRADVRELDSTRLDDLQRAHLDSSITTQYAVGQGYWNQGDGHPPIVFDPPTAQAAGRCAASRIRGVDVRSLAVGSIHPERCRWCATPLEQLLRSLDHAVFMSRFVATEMLVWPTADANAPYVRDTGRAGSYENPAWASFFALDRDDRAYLIAQAAASPVATR